MPNGLTGDFEAVLQVSGGTIDRLLATMHQNIGNEAKPSFPHVAYFRLGDTAHSDGVHGSVAAQIGVPHVDLIHGSTDRFRLHVGIRARYRPDPGSTPLADMIHGTVHAEYEIRDIDPSCFGWRGIADDYIWMQVVKDTVRFDGDLLNESSIMTVIGLLDEQAVKAIVERHLAVLLETQFAPQPQPLGKRFRRMRSLSSGGGPSQSAIAMPFGLNSDTPPGNVASIGNMFLDGRDFGLAVSSSVVMASIQPKLAALGGLQRDFRVTGDAGFGGGLSIDYHVRVNGATAEWLGPAVIPVVSVSGGLVRLRVTGIGFATRLYRSGVFNVGSVSINDLKMTFDVDQFLLLGFDAGAERLTVGTLGPPHVSVSYNGPFAGYVKPLAEDTVSKQVQANLGGPLAQAQNELASLTAAGRKTALIDQLKRLDDAAHVRFTDALFHVQGLVMRGAIPLSHRYVPHASFVKTAAGDGFDAIESWIPGGRVDSFEWSWRWFTNGIEGPPGPPGSSSREASFLLTRSQGPRSKFGLALSREQPLPGLDGHGRMCLVIKGVHVDHVSGALVPVTSVKECAQFGHDFRMPYEVGPYLRVCDPLRALPDRPAPEIGLMHVGVSEATASVSNTLVLYLADAWNDEAAATLRAGLHGCRREGAGLLVLLLFRDGALGGHVYDLQHRLRELREGLEASLLVSEDVRGGWAAALALPARTDEPVWRLLTPQGVVSWAHDGYVEGERLSSVLDARLVASAPAALARLHSDTAIGVRLPIELITQQCPPVPLSRFGTSGTKLVFVHKDRASSVAGLERLAREYHARGDDGPFLAIVVEGANAEEAEALRKELKLDVPMFADPNGALTRRAGVRLSPMTLTIDDLGRLTRFEPGVDVTDHASVATGEAE